MTSYKPASRCPECRRPPAIRFPEEAVEGARQERGGKRRMTVACTRCGTVYWIRARDIAAAIIDRSASPA